MKRIKDWIRIKLRRFLDVEGLEYSLDGFVKSTNKNLTQLSSEINFTKNNVNIIHKDLKNDISHFQESVNTLHNTVENVVHIGTDVSVDRGYYRRSWSVICIEGKINIVKFIDLNRSEAQEIMRFLKHFEAGKHCIDAPQKEFFYDGMFKF